MNDTVYRFDAMIQKNPDMDAAYIIFPYDIREVYGKGKVKVHATFDGAPYDGSIVNMSVKDADGKVCYVIGMTKAIRKKKTVKPSAIPLLSRFAKEYRRKIWIR